MKAQGVRVRRKVKRTIAL